MLNFSKDRVWPGSRVSYRVLLLLSILVPLLAYPSQSIKMSLTAKALLFVSVKSVIRILPKPPLVEENFSP